jgi:transcriptional regulator of acetoin/glycerol metabolism
MGVPEGPDALDGVERRHVADVLKKAGWNKVQTAKALGVSRRTLYRMIERYGLEEPRSGGDTPGS